MLHQRILYFIHIIYNNSVLLYTKLYIINFLLKNMSKSTSPKTGSVRPREEVVDGMPSRDSNDTKSFASTNNTVVYTDTSHMKTGHLWALDPLTKAPVGLCKYCNLSVESRVIDRECPKHNKYFFWENGKLKQARFVLE